MKRELYESLEKHNLRDLKVSQLTPEEDISFLGLNIALKREGPLSYIALDQVGYLDSLLSIYEEELSAITRNPPTPCGDDAFRPTDEGTDLEPVNTTQFLSKLMRTRYLVRTRPDIELAISILTTKSRSPTKGDNKRLNRVLCYLRGTRELGIRLHRVANIQIHAYVDAAYAVHPKMESHTGYIVTLDKFGPPLQYKSIKQKLNVNSSTEAEIVIGRAV